jgi:hypothetical protein
VEGRSLPIYRYTNESVKTTTGDSDAVNPLKIPQNHTSFYRSLRIGVSPSLSTGTEKDDLQLPDSVPDLCPFQRSIRAIVKDPVLAPFPIPASARIPSGSHEMQLLLDSQVAISLYDIINSVLPSAVSAASLLSAVINASTNVQKSILQKTESCLQLQQYIQEYVSTMSDLALTKMMQNPAYSAMLGVAMALLSVAAILIFLGGVTFGISTIVGVVLLVTALALLGVYIGEASHAYKQDHDKLARLVKAHGGATTIFGKFYQDALNHLNLIFGLMIGLLLATAAFSFLGGAQIGRAGATVMNMIVRAMILAGTNASTVATEASASAQLYGAFLQKDNAKMVYQYALENARMQQWAAESTYFTSMQERISQAVKSIWEYLEELYTAQSDLIKTFGEGSLAITRSIVI